MVEYRLLVNDEEMTEGWVSWQELYGAVMPFLANHVVALGTFMSGLYNPDKLFDGQGSIKAEPMLDSIEIQRREV
jgi:hypothetical protein